MKKIIESRLCLHYTSDDNTYIRSTGCHCNVIFISFTCKFVASIITNANRFRIWDTEVEGEKAVWFLGSLASRGPCKTMKLSTSVFTRHNIHLIQWRNFASAFLINSWKIAVICLKIHINTSLITLLIHLQPGNRRGVDWQEKVLHDGALAYNWQCCKLSGFASSSSNLYYSFGCLALAHNNEF